MSNNLNLWYLQTNPSKRKWNGEGVVAAIIDSGVDGSHPEFTGRNNLVQYGFDGKGNLIRLNSGVNHDSHGHGTMVAGLICGKTVGVAREATVVSIKLEVESVPGLIRAIEELIELKRKINIRIVNITYNEPGFFSVIQKLVGGLEQVGILPVISVGNWKNQDIPGTYCPGNVAVSYYPGNIPEGISVGAVDRDGNVWDNSVRGKISKFPDYCFPDVVAPGVNLPWCEAGSGRIGLGSGTSEAAAYVIGWICCLLERDPFFTTLILKNELFMRCQFLPNTNPNKQVKCLVHVQSLQNR